MEVKSNVLQLEPEEAQARAQEIMAKLLSCWCIPRGKSLETKLDYDFIATHAEYFDTVLRLCGHGGLTILTAAGREVAYISGCNTAICRKFNKDESIVLLRLLQEYLRCRTRISLSGGHTDMFAGDLLEHINVTRRIPMDLKELLKILTTLDTYNFIWIDLRRKDDFCSETILTIMPSISCLLPYVTIESIDLILQDYANETTKRKKANADPGFGDSDTNLSEEE